MIELKKKLKRRKWKPFYFSDAKKIFSGYCGSGFAIEVDEPHEVHSLVLRPSGWSRGVSSVSQCFVDKDGYGYSMAAKVTSKFLTLIASGDVQLIDGWFHMKAIQVKQGDELSIEALSNEEVKDD
ncbi:MAG: hypothetical protein HRT47_01605 [Candidatus Caenarcaniphilales bacterium]|nr:hypothetical protein [Candidatus Caenarcaniphilales bacterium]